LRKLTIEFIKEEFNKKGYELLEKTYINCKQKLSYLCPKHGKQTIRYSNFRLSKGGCRGCSHESYRVDFNKVEEYFIKVGYKLIPNQIYKNQYQKLKYICKKHGEKEITLNNLINGNGCKECGNERRFESLRKNTNEVEKVFSDAGYILIRGQKYINCYQKLKYICPRHGEKEISFNGISKGNRCRECHEESLIGEGNPMYGKTGENAPMWGGYGRKKLSLERRFIRNEKLSP